MSRDESFKRVFDRTALSRRSLLAGMAAVASPAILTPSRAQSRSRLAIRDAGGVFTEVFTEVLYRPFTRKTGIEVLPMTSTPDPTAQVKAMVETSNYEWDVVALSIASHDLLRDAGYLEKLDLDSDPTVQQVAPQFRTPYLVGDEIYASILAYRKDKPHPTGGWKDLWDVAKFPGRRGLRKHVFDTIEIALLADGVPLAQLYPCDFDRAYKSLDRIKRNVSVWWSAGGETAQLLQSGELDYCATFNTRAQAAIDAGAPLEISWNQGLYIQSGWSIPKGAPKANLAREFIKFASQAEIQAAYCSRLGVGPANLGAYNYIDKARARLLPTFPENLAQMTAQSSDFWGKNKDVAMERFLDWVIK